jgi:hypothetical protein
MIRKLVKRDCLVSEIRRYLEPGPIVLVSSKLKGKTNIMTLGWHTVMEFTPYVLLDILRFQFHCSDSPCSNPHHLSCSLHSAVRRAGVFRDSVSRTLAGRREQHRCFRILHRLERDKRHQKFEQFERQYGPVAEVGPEGDGLRQNGLKNPGSDSQRRVL